MRYFLLLFLLWLPARGATLKDLSFIAGHWVERTREAVNEEVWTGPEGDAMYGMFRSVETAPGETSPRTTFAEFMSMEQRGEDVVLVMRHFKPGLIALEEKTQPLLWHLKSIEPKKVVFRMDDGTELEYESPSYTKLTITLVKKRDTKTTRLGFVFTRAPQPPEPPPAASGPRGRPWMVGPAKQP